MKTIYLKVEVPDWATGYNVTLNGGVIPNITAISKEIQLPTDEEIKDYESKFTGDIAKQYFESGVYWLLNKIKQ